MIEETSDQKRNAELLKKIDEVLKMVPRGTMLTEPLIAILADLDARIVSLEREIDIRDKRVLSVLSADKK